MLIVGVAAVLGAVVVASTASAKPPEKSSFDNFPSAAF